MKNPSSAFFGSCAILLFITFLPALAAPSSPPSDAVRVQTGSTTLTPDEWQELRTARAAALKANPQLVKKNAELSAKLREFQQKLDAAMLKTDPSLAPYLASYSPRFHPAPIPGMQSAGHPANQSSAFLQPAASATR